MGFNFAAATATTRVLPWRWFSGLSPQREPPTELYLTVIDLRTAAAIGALVDAALVHQLSVVSLEDCRLSASAVPALARLLDGGAVTKVCLHPCSTDEVLWADEAGAALLCDALQRNKSITALHINGLDLWHIPTVGVALLGALTGHPSLQHLDISGNIVEEEESAGAALGALVAADAALTSLDISSCLVDDEALGPLVDALPRNTRLHTLICHDDELGFEELTEPFVRDRLLPAVRANTGLRQLDLGELQWASALEAQVLVARRAH
jgi:hypothetical protein